MSLVTTAGASDAVSYVDTAYIDTYAATTEWASDWSGKSTPEKEVLAVRAARAVDVIPFLGYPTSSTQARQFPRFESPDARGCYYDSATIPEPIKRAQAHIAAWLSSLEDGADPFSLDDTGKFSSLTVGPISMDFRGTVGADGASFLSSVIAPMLRPWGLVGAAGTVRLTRG